MPSLGEVVPLRPNLEQGEPRPANGNYPATATSLGNLALGLSPAAPEQVNAPLSANARLRRGAVEGFVRTCERWRLSHIEQVILLGYRGDELTAQPVLMGRTRASQDVRDRAGYLLSISIGLAALYGDSIDAELAWLGRPHQALQGTTPLNFMLDGKMVSMIRVHGLVMAERGL